jgi:hypothetical protein
MTTRNELIARCAKLEQAGDVEALADALEQLVDAHLDADDPKRAVADQRRLIAIVERLHGADSTEVADELRWLGEILQDLVWPDGDHDEDDGAPDRDALAQADLALAGAQRRYEAAGGAGDVDALGSLALRIDLAAGVEQRDRVLELARTLLDGSAAPPRKRDVKKVAKLLEGAAASCDWLGLIQPAELLGRRAAELSGKPFVSRKLVLSDGPPQLEIVPAKKPVIARGKTSGVDALAGVLVRNVGGPIDELEIVCQGPAIGSSMVGTIAITVVDRGDDDPRVVLDRVAPDRARGRLRVRMKAGVVDAARLEKLGSPRLADAMSAAEAQLLLSARSLAPGESRLTWTIAPARHLEGAAVIEVPVVITGRSRGAS